jgi:hypothetical protein
MRNILIAMLVAGGIGLVGALGASAAPVTGSGAREALPDITEHVQHWRWGSRGRHWRYGSRGGHWRWGSRGGHWRYGSRGRHWRYGSRGRY